MNKIVTYIKERYNNIPIFVTENGKWIKAGQNLNVLVITFFTFPPKEQLNFHEGYGEKNKPNTQTEDLLNDTRRVDYMSSYLGALETSMRYKHCYNIIYMHHLLL